MIKMLSAVIEILSFSCCALLLVTADGSHVGMLNCKKSKWLGTRNTLAESWIKFNGGLLRFSRVQVYAIFGSHLGKAICINLKMFYSGTTVIKSEQNSFMFS